MAQNIADDELALRPTGRLDDASCLVERRRQGLLDEDVRARLQLRIARSAWLSV